MNELLETTSPAASAALLIDLESEAIRKALIGNKVTLKATAVALHVSLRTLYYAVEHKPVPYVVIFGTRYYEPADLARAVVAEKNTAPRGRGRPRKAA